MKTKTVNMRTFNRDMYNSLKEMPLVVINSHTGEEVFYVIPAHRMEAILNAIRTKDVNK